jgi:TolB protein
MSLRAVACACAVALLLAAGCTERRRGDPDAGDGDARGSTGDIRIEPADLVMTITGSPAVVEYHAFVGDRDVTSEVTWTSTVAPLGTFAGNVFTSAVDRGGRTTIRARMGSLEGLTSLTLRISSTIVGPGAPSDAASRFDAATPDPSITPSIVYPADGVVIPPNLRELEFHVRSGGAMLHELRFQTVGADLRIYFGCPEAVGGGCIYMPDAPAWETIATAARGTGELTYSLRAIDASGRLGDAGTRRMTITEEDITGGLYYWNAGGGTINRFEFGVPGARAERFLDNARTGAFMCVGCHFLSRDGTRLGVGTDIPTTTFQVFDVASRTRVFSQGGGGGPFGFPTQPNFSSFSPDNLYIVSSSAMGLTIRDGATGNQIAGPLGGGPGEMPDWSPDGEHIVYVRHDNMVPGGFPLYDFSSVSSGRIETLVGSGGTWGAGPVLAPSAGGNNYYPAYSPDGRWVVYIRSPSNTPSMGMDSSSAMTAYVADAQQWIVRADGSAPATEMLNAAGLADSWPKWDPTIYRDGSRTIFWYAWSSRRGYGLRYDDLGAPTQIWMAAFDPDRGGDPSFPAFRLPFQDIATGNHIPQWTTTVERMDCTSDADCPGEFCVAGRCYEQVPLI